MSFESNRRDRKTRVYENKTHFIHWKYYNIITTFTVLMGRYVYFLRFYQKKKNK